MSAQMDVSVVIPSYNGEQTIRACLDSLRNQKRAPEEVIVVDSSTDATPQIIRAEYPEVRLVRREQQTYCGAARNIGVEEARGDVVAITDTDCVAMPHWLEAFETAMQEHGVVAVGGGIGGPEDESWVAALERLKVSEYLPTSPARWTNRAAGGNFAIRRNVYRELGGCPDLRISEDVVFFKRLTERHGLLYFEPRATVLHLSSPQIEDLYRRQWQLGVAFGEARMFDPSLPGAAAVRHRWLIPLLPGMKGLRILARLAKYDRRLLTTALRHGPTFSYCMWLWMKGLLEETRVR